MGLLVAGALFATACGGSETGDAGTDVDEILDQFAYPGPEPEGEPQHGGSVTYALEAATRDGWCMPEAQLAISGIQVARAVYDTLTVPDGEGSFQPHLAESVEHNDDYTEWTIGLRDGIEFHDGTALDAEVVKNNLDAYRGAYEGRSSLLIMFVLEDIEDVRVEDDLTVVVETARPWVGFDSFLYLSGRLGIVAQDQLDDPNNCDSNLIGTGPFVFESWDRNSNDIRLSRNEDYWREDAQGNQLPYLDEMQFRVITSAEDAANALRSGEIDAFHMSSNTEALLFWDVAEEADQGDMNLVWSDEFAEVGFLMFNNAEPPFDNPLARQAVAHAVDRDGIAAEVSQGFNTPASGPFAPGAAGYLEDSGFPGYDPERAEELVEEYQQDTGEALEIRITHTPEQSLRRLVNMIQQDLEAVGISVRTNTFEQSELIENAIGGNFEMMTFRNFPGLDPDNLYVWWYGNSPVNFGNIEDEELDRLLDQGREATDPAERAEIYEGVNSRFGEQVFNFWTTWTSWGVPSTTDVHGIVGARPAEIPDGSADYSGLATGHDPALLWKAQD